MPFILWTNLRNKLSLKNGFGCHKTSPWTKHTISHKKNLISLNRNYKFHFFKTTSELRPEFDEGFNIYQPFQAIIWPCFTVIYNKDTLSNHLQHSSVLLYGTVGQDPWNPRRLSFHNHCAQRKIWYQIGLVDTEIMPAESPLQQNFACFNRVFFLSFSMMTSYMHFKCPNNKLPW